MELGATDYLVKQNIHKKALISSLDYARKRSRAEVEVNLLLEVTKTISQAEDFHAALAVILRLLCTTINWDFAEAWILSQDSRVLEYSSGWYASKESLAEFGLISEKLKFTPGMDLVGQIWLSGKPEWIADVSQAKESISWHCQMAATMGLKSCFAVPILGDNQVNGVLVLWKEAKTKKNQHLLELANAVATQIGLYIQHKKVEAALLLSEERLNLAIAASDLGLWDWNINTGEVYFSPNWKSMLGYEVEEIENSYRSWEELLHPEDLPRALQVLNQHLAGATDFYETEIRMRSKSGEWKWILSKGKVFHRDEFGKPMRMTGTHQDISGRKLAEAATLQLNRKLQESQRIAHIGNWEFDVLSGTISLSEELFRIFGIEPNYLHTFAEFIAQIHPEDRDQFLQVIEQALTEGTPYEIDHRIIRKNGEIRYLNSKGQALRANHKHQENYGYVLRLFGTAIDITERCQAEAALQQQFLRQRLLSAILDRIRRSLNESEVLQTAVEEVRQFLLTDRTIIYRFNPDWSGVAVVESVGEDWMPILGIDIQDQCFLETYVPLYSLGRIRAIENIYTAGLNECHLNRLAEFQVQANLVVPILQGEKLWGLLIAHHCIRPRQWQESEIDCLNQLCVQLGIAIQQSTLFQKSQIEIAERQKAELALRESQRKLQEKNQQLSIALNDLRQTQSQLIQNEKMVSLGQLVAGIAHEINNPVNFIYGNLNYASQYLDDLYQLVQLYQKNYVKPAAEIQKHIEGIDLDFIAQDLPKLLTSMQAGAERIEKIVKSLRTFSRLDEAEMKRVDIHEGIESTLMLLQNRLTSRGKNPPINVVRNYSDLPTVECYAGQLNQVIINLLNNAIEALEERDKKRTPQEICQHPSTIKISTYLSPEGDIVIAIADNGPGIPESIRPRIFDPFFTTKPVGKGTGLGLSISHSIIERHGGEITCFSTPGEGTEFMIEIPLKKCKARVRMPVLPPENQNPVLSEESR